MKSKVRINLLATAVVQEITAYIICHVPEGGRVFGTLTVEENLSLGACPRFTKLAGKLLSHNARSQTDD
jgi:ABC-type branched-subunit amino acid transport system ATPase component